MDIHGFSIVAGERTAEGATFYAIEQASGRVLDPPFRSAGIRDVVKACAAAQAASVEFAGDPGRRAQLLDTIADEISALGDPLLERASAESGLPLPRLVIERERMIGQLRLFASEVRDGGWRGLRIDPALPSGASMARPDLRLRMVPVGPVAVFGASNFPLAFSVAGGDTVAALAAGCPVIVKGHPAHPGTSELVAAAVTRAIKAVELPAGTFSHIVGPSNELGAALVADPRIKAVGFTGSRAGGLALMQIAAARDVPIPVFAEMSSVNPVLLLPAALKARAEALGREFVGSLTLGAGQFCTNPGLILAIAGKALDRFILAARSELESVSPATMLTSTIHRTFEETRDQLAACAGVEITAEGRKGAELQSGQAAIFAVDAAAFHSNEVLRREVFGASSVIVRCRDEAEIVGVIERLDGQLAATLQYDEGDLPMAGRLLPLLEARCGRVLANGWPTGVAVSHAMVHGGPFPATSNGGYTSVGTLAIDRFLRPICYQDIPDALLPPELRGAGLATAPRRIDGVLVAGGKLPLASPGRD